MRTSFTIDRATAQLSTKVELDKETKDTYTVMVTATDPSNETATVTVTIKVTGRRRSTGNQQGTAERRPRVRRRHCGAHGC